MIERNGTRLWTANAIIWAALIIATSLIVAGTDATGSQKMTLMLIQIAGWISLHVLLRRKTKGS